MNDDMITLEVVDADGAIRESLDELGSDTRGDFLRKAAVGSGGLLAGGVLMGGLPTVAEASRRSRARDVKILNYALTLEYLEAAFYNRAVRKGALSGEVLRAAKIVRRHENAHVKALRAALGSAAVKRPKFDFKGTTEDQQKFLQVAVVLENTGVAAYAGQAANIKQRPLIQAAASILTVEARHAAHFNELAGKSFAPRSFDKAKSKRRILREVRETGFIQD